TSALSSSCYVVLRALHSFPTRRSSDLYSNLDSFQSQTLSFGSCHCSIAYFFLPAFILYMRRVDNTWLRFFLIRQISSLCTSWSRSEEHTSELQSRFELVCRLLLEKTND